MYLDLTKGVGLDAALQCLIQSRSQGVGNQSNAFFGWGGGSRGVSLAGCFSGLSSYGLESHFDVAAVTSTSAAPTAYFLAGQADLFARAFPRVCSTRTLIDPFRRGIFAFGRMEKMMRRGPLALDVPALLRSPTAFYVGVRTPDGVGRLLDVKAAKDPFLPLLATKALPGRLGDGEPVVIDGEQYWDPFVMDPELVDWVIEQFKPSSALLSPNRRFLSLPISMGNGNWADRLRRVSTRAIERLLYTYLLRGFPRGYQEKARQFQELARESFTRLIHNERFSVGILPTSRLVSTLTTDRRRLRAAADKAEAMIGQIMTKVLLNSSLAQPVQDSVGMSIERILDTRRKSES